MKVKFEFDTESEFFDRYELQRHIYADKMAYCLSRITDQLRNWYKWDERESIPVDEIHEKLWDIIQEEISMEEIGY